MKPKGLGVGAAAVAIAIATAGYLALRDAPIPLRVITVAWDANPPEENVTGYRVYVGDRMAADVAVSSAAIYGLEWGDSHTLTVTAYNKEGLESERSAPLVVNPPPLMIDGGLAGLGPKRLAVSGWPGAELSIEGSANLVEWTEVDQLDLGRDRVSEVIVTPEGDRGFWRVKPR